MFTGIIELLGEIKSIEHEGSNIIIRVASDISGDLQVDQSLAHDGTCLTVTKLGDGWHEVVAIQETLDRTALSSWAKGKKVNLERAMIMNARLDGHIVQGHVDAVGRCVSLENKDGSWRYGFDYPEQYAHLMVPKGSICINGISLTANEPTMSRFYVDIIPYTYEHTNVHQWQVGNDVNLEFDILGKYVERLMSVKK